MGLLKGAISLTRYKIMDSAKSFDAEEMAEKLKQNAFMDIEAIPEEKSVGWVEVNNMLSTEFDPTSFWFGQVMSWNLRIDKRSISASMLNKYLTMAEAEYVGRSGEVLKADEKKNMKAKVKQDLLRRVPVTTKTIEVCWLKNKNEIWLAGNSAKDQEIFEEKWSNTFHIGLVMKIPYLLAEDLLSGTSDPMALGNLKSSAFFGQGA